MNTKSRASLQNPRPKRRGKEAGEGGHANLHTPGGGKGDHITTSKGYVDWCLNDRGMETASKSRQAEFYIRGQRNKGHRLRANSTGHLRSGVPRSVFQSQPIRRDHLTSVHLGYMARFRGGPSRGGKGKPTRRTTALVKKRIGRSSQ